VEPVRLLSHDGGGRPRHTTVAGGVHV
jgi:hypothetical protein